MKQPLNSAGTTVAAFAADDPRFKDCLKIRFEVFVDEQGVPASEERDALDATALHFLLTVDGTAAGTARVVFKQAGETAKIGRVALRAAARNRGHGAVLMRAVEAAAQLAQARRLVLDAQCRAQHFYERLGYAAAGEIFMEAGIAHRHMVKTKEGGAAF